MVWGVEFRIFVLVCKLQPGNSFQGVLPCCSDSLPDVHRFRRHVVGLEFQPKCPPKKPSPEMQNDPRTVRRISCAVEPLQSYKALQQSPKTESNPRFSKLALDRKLNLKTPLRSPKP